MKRVWQNLEQYQLISLSLAFIVGILFHHHSPLSLETAALLSLLLLVSALFTLRRSSCRCSILVLLLLSSSLGFFRTAHVTTQSEQETNIYHTITEETEVILGGTLHRMVLFDGEKSTILLKSQALRKREQEFFSPVSGLVQLRLYDRWPQTLKPGAQVIVRCRLSRPYRFGNPGGFDYPGFLAAKAIHIVGKINSTSHIHPLKYEETWLRTLYYLPENLRVTIRDFVNKTFPPEQAGIYRALLIGDRSGIDKERLESFKASGTTHILAISGLHLSLVASGLFLLFYWLLRRSSYLLLHFSCKKLALLATIPPLCVYALLAGAQTPVLRSLIMVIIFILSFCVQRQHAPFTTLSCAALLVLFLNPLSLFTVSFQLSFMAVAALILILPQLLTVVEPGDSEECGFRKRFLAKFSRWLLAAFLVSIGATIGTAPLLLHSFNRISPLGPVANLLLEPLLCFWSLPFGLLSTALLSIAPEYAESLLLIGGLGITASMYLTDFLSALPASTLWFATPSILLILSYYASLALCFSRFSHKLTIPFFLLICSLFLFPPRSFYHALISGSELVFLDVGQGSSTFIRFPEGKKILIDGGGASSKKFNVGESIIAPYLWHRGISRLDAILISHPDADHYNGIPFLLRRFKPETLWVNGDDSQDLRYQELLDLARKLDIQVRKVGDELPILAEKGAELRTIHNPLQGKEGENSNDKSVILRFTDGTFSCILPGDISSKVEQTLVQNNTKLAADILLSPHHGSKTSSSYAFLDRVRPELIIVSAGRFRPSLFPSPQLRTYCKEQHVQLLNTAKQGAISIRTGAENGTVNSLETFR